MKFNKYFALLVGVLALSGCVNPQTTSDPSTPDTPSNSENSDTSLPEFEAVSLDVVKSTYKNNQEVNAEGVVYGVTKNGFFMADSATSYIFVNMGDNWTATVKIGDKVIFNKFNGSEFKINNENYTIIKEKDILAIIKD